jgi:hypothetical protein
MCSNIIKITFLAMTIFDVFNMESCSVKEDRKDCPCHLVLDFSNAPEGISDTLTVLIKSEGYLHLDTVFLKPLPGGTYYDIDYDLSKGGDPVITPMKTSGPPTNIYEVDVPKKDLQLFIITGGMIGLLPFAATIPEGCDCPDTYLMSKMLDTRCDELKLPVELHKSYCKLTIHYRNETSKRYSLKVLSPVSGFLYDGSPSVLPSAVFDFEMKVKGDGDCSVRLPRQMDASLMLNVNYKQKVLRSFALGEFIEESGYDWTKEDLEDLDVTIDYTATSVSFTVGKWTKTFNYELVI